MVIRLDENYNAMTSTALLGYVGETNARPVSVEGLTVDGADRYVLTIDYGDGTVYDVDISNGTWTPTADILRVARNVSCQISARKYDNGNYTLVKKSKIFSLRIGQALSDGVAPIPSPSVAADALDRIDAIGRQAHADMQTAQSAADTATTAANNATKSATAAGVSADTATQAASRAETAQTSAETSATQADTARQGAETARDEAVTAQNNAKISADIAAAAAQQTTADKTATAGYAQTAKTNADSTAADRQAVQTLAERVTVDKATVEENAAQVAEDRTAAETAAQTAQAVADSLPDDYVTAVGKIAENTAEINNTNTEISELKEDLTEISESSFKPTVIELHPTKNSGYHWNGTVTPSSSYFYFHVNVKEGDVVSIPLSISGDALQFYRFIDAYNGDVRNNGASHNPSSPDAAKEYTVPKNVDNIYISINFRQDYYEYYYVSILRTVEELEPKGISNLIKRVSNLENVIVETKNGYTLKKEMDNLASGSLITLSEHIDNKKNKSYRFSAKFNTFSSVTIGHGYNVYGGSWVTVDNTNVTAYYYNGSQAVQMGQYAHGLTISDFIDVIITVGNVENVRAVVTVMSVGGDFTQSNVPMGGCNGSVFAFGGQDLIDVVYSYNLADMLSDVWLFGDSYISLGDPNRWTYQLMQYGYKDLLMCGFSGATSSNEILAFREIMQIGKPKIVVWALGMNDADNGQVNQTWLASVNEVISFCAENGIELVLATIPCTPRVDNSYKNAYIKESTYRYIDFAKAVNGETVGSSWYADMLSSDNVHPVALGAKALANRFILDMPEIIKN